MTPSTCACIRPAPSSGPGCRQAACLSRIRPWLSLFPGVKALGTSSSARPRGRRLESFHPGGQEGEGSADSACGPATRARLGQACRARLVCTVWLSTFAGDAIFGEFYHLVLRLLLSEVQLHAHDHHWRLVWLSMCLPFIKVSPQEWINV